MPLCAIKKGSDKERKGLGLAFELGKQEQFAHNS